MVVVLPASIWAMMPILRVFCERGLPCIVGLRVLSRCDTHVVSVLVVADMCLDTV